MNKEKNKSIVIDDMKVKLQDILIAVSWREISNTYFNKSSFWFYNKMNGIDGNGGKGGFTQAEAEQLKAGLIDLSNRIKRAAEAICNTKE